MTVERTGTAQTFATTLSSDSFSLTVPGDATLAVVFFSGYSTTPFTSIGSCLWMMCADFNETNSFVARANNTIEFSEDFGGWANMALIRPTVQPQIGGAAFTIGETDSAGKITWIALEVQAAEAVVPVSVAWFMA